jgi:hypothetical protein
VPPITPFTSQVTLSFELPVTMAWNCCVEPRNKFAPLGDTLTPTFDGGPGFFGGVPAIPQLISEIAARQKIARAAARQNLPLRPEFMRAAEPGGRSDVSSSRGVLIGAGVKARDVPHRGTARRWLG